MKKKQKKDKRYIIIEFDGTTTRACTFRSPNRIIISKVKGMYESQAKLHPDDVYDQNEGIRIALKRLGFEIVKYPFDGVYERFKEMVINLIMTGETK